MYSYFLSLSLSKGQSIVCSNSPKFCALKTSKPHSSTLNTSKTASSIPPTKYHHSFHFQTIPDGLPPEHPITIFEFSELMRSMEAAAAPILHQMLTSADYGTHSENPVTCIVADGLLAFATEIAHQIGVPHLYFETISPCCLWTYMCLPKLIQAGDLPFKDENLDETIRNVPGMEGIMRRRDLPGFCRGIDFNDTQVELVLREINNIPLAPGLILNTFHQRDAPILSQMLELCPNIYAIGPLHTHLQTRLALDQPINSTSIWEEDRSCISWLDKQPPTSVLYVSIGSLAVMTKDQFFELLHGVVNSGSRFLWVWRPRFVADLDLDPMSDDGIPVELLQSRRERGCTVRWAPQQEVLAHPAIGGFLNHGGWNSTLESIVSGIL